MASTTHSSSLLSLLYLALLTFVGSAVLLAEMHQHSPLSHNVHAFLAVLMISSCIWMLWFGWHSAGNKHLKVHQDHQAGASWLKGGLSLFALATLVLDCLSLGYYYELQHCASMLITTFPVVQAVFTIIQVSLLLFNAKVCIQEHQHLNRFGLMHTLATNVLLWMSMVLDESMKQLEEFYDAHKGESSQASHGGSYTNSCICTTSLCHIFSEGAAYLYPFNIEFSLFSSTMLYIIWKNTGRETHHQKPQLTHNRRFLLSGAFVGLVLGALAISATFGVMISFGVLAKSHETIPEALRIYYIFNSVLLSAMFLATLIGIATYRVKKKAAALSSDKSVVRNLDVTLLLGSSCGPLMVSIFSLVAIFFLHANGSLHLLDFCFSLCKTIQILGQNLFITEALYSSLSQEPDAPENSDSSATSWVFSISRGPMEQDNNGPLSKTHTLTNFMASLENQPPGHLADYGGDPSLFQISDIQRESKRPSIRRKILQNISILLIFYNISVWILYAYGTRPHLVSQTEQSFYGFTLWAIVVKISLPLGIFYRMHSVASLFEVYCKTC
ncbi:proton channel OTOP2-like [Hemicordylus capensis]|uniref:proton channel OTOP2-like n=1 Tax=Hemicordylus capensis TaxID=884348 RepID=UPI002304712D|nr:proton channel OTOP2-like [Hemicordylus capensis]XP_053162195.1 proton channel OTOP2-like [Hemicordylus capensis]XP_053162196.1 proton channel OTOP2-like [Hemicordylus capensis]XP_053162197.1 proton channel OTOP2-like [Hemicordylus capensis]